MTNHPNLDWSLVLDCREFWIDYFRLTDDKLFQPQKTFHREHYSKLFDALTVLLRGRSLNVTLPIGFSLTFAFGDRNPQAMFDRDSLCLVQTGKRKRHLLGWVNPNSYNHVFRFDEISLIAALPNEELPEHLMFLLLLRYWGIADADSPRSQKIVKQIGLNLRKLNLFDKTEINHICTKFEAAQQRVTGCDWGEHPKWGIVAKSPKSLRCPNSIDIPDGVTFNFRLFNQFINNVHST